MMFGVGGDDTAYRYFFSNMIRWLANREQRKHFSVSPDKEFYHSGEMARFDAQLYTHDFKPFDGAELLLQLNGPRGTQEKEMIGRGNGKYSAEMLVVKAGDYSYRAVAAKDGVIFYEDRGTFSADNWNLEYLQTTAREEELRNLAEKTGGTLLGGDNFGTLLDIIDDAPRRLSESREWQLWNAPLLLIVICVLLTVEWWLRKKKGMV